MRKDAIPMILIYGWPGSFYEFDRLVDNLDAPQSESDSAFHVVVPSLPCFCWSSNPPKRGWTLQYNSRLFDQLMAGLGYDAYVAQLSDCGSFVARQLGSKYFRCRAVHLDFSPATVYFMSESVSRKKRCERSQDWLDNHLGYAVCMRTRPHTLGYGFHDNPMGILSWVGEKYYELMSPARRTDPAWDQRILTQASRTILVDASCLPCFPTMRTLNMLNSRNFL
ncbi:Alpha/Beta hydrolase protein [Aspergillus nidulans var. acristatus]